jgi:hypothetical protein
MATCQICGRDIKAKNGVIAHHGYTRPGSGWQTESCFGARYLPYEISSDAIPLAMDSLKTYIFNENNHLSNIMTNPPEYLEHSEYSGFSGRHMVKYNKPDGFNPKKLSSTYSSMTQRYEIEFSNLKNQIEKNIESSYKYIDYLEERLRNWLHIG